MSDQVYYNNPPDQSIQNGKNNGLMWALLVGFVVVLIFMYMIFRGGAENSNLAVQNPQETQIPQDPQNTQIPQNPQETQIPQSTTIPVPTE